MIYSIWISFVLLVVSAIFAWHAWIGWRTQSVRFPISVLTLQEFERDRSSANFLGMMTADVAISLCTSVAALFVAGDALLVSAKPVRALAALNGCYEGEGLPDFMRPRAHWKLRISDGVISDTFGTPVSRIRIVGHTPHGSSIAFSPGIGDFTDKQRGISTITVGDAVAGTAYTRRNRTTITLIDDWGDVLLRTSCG